MLSFITDLFGPIFAKEMVEIARRWRYYQNRIIFGMVLLLVLFVVYQNSSYFYKIRGGLTLRDLSKMAEDFFLSYLWVQYLAVFIFVPFFLTGVISGEREQKTLDLLFTTQLHDREIIFGKLGSRVVTMLLLIFSGIPVVALTMLFGGVNVQVFLHGMISTLLAVLYASAFAIYFSTTTKTTLGALVRTYWWMLCWILIVPLVFALGIELGMELARRAGLTMQSAMWWGELWLVFIALINPIAPFVVSVIDFFTGRLTIVLGPWYFYYLLILPLLWSLLLILLAVRNVRRDPGPRRIAIVLRKVLATVGNILILKPVTSSVLRRLPQSRADHWLWMPVHNPLWQRSRRAWVYDREQHLQRAQLGGWLLVFLTLILLVCVESSFFRHPESALVFLVWIWLGLAIIASLVAGVSIMNDRRKGFFEFVLVTPLESWEVIHGTILSCWRHIKKLYVLTIVMTLFFVFVGSVTVAGAITSLIMGSLAIGLSMLHGIACSLAARSLAGALIASFAFPLVVVIASPLLSGMFRDSGLVVYMVVCLIFLPVSWLISLWKKNAFTVAWFFSMVHLAIVGLMTCWVVAVKDHNLPMMAVHPGVHILEPLMEYRYSTRERFRNVWSAVQVLYAAGLLLNSVWIFWYLCRHYEVLSGRQDIIRRKQVSKYKKR